MEASEKGLNSAGGVDDLGEPAPDPKRLAGSLLRTLHDIPWVSLGAIGTGVGVALLYAYFRSIDFMPSDIPSILGASVFVALLALGFYLWVVLSLIGPVWAFRELGLPVASPQDRPASGFERWSLPALQVLGVGLLLLYIGVRSSLGCEAIAPWFLVLGLALALLGSAAWGLSERATAGHRAAWWRRLLPALGVCCAGILPFLGLLALLPSEGGTGWWSLVFVLLMWLLVVGATRWEGIPVWAYALGVTALLPAVMFSLPSLLGHSAHFPATVAQMAGIRAAKVDELRVPDSTCRLIQSALGKRAAVQGVHCDTDGWGTVHARVLSSFGPRWLIEVQTASPQQPPAPPERMRLTIPGEGVHLVRHPAPTPRDACARE